VCTDRCVCYLEGWCAPIGVSVMWRAGVHRLVCLLCAGLVCTDWLPEILRPRRKVEVFVTSREDNFKRIV
jgi:hypothetical protein